MYVHYGVCPSLCQIEIMRAIIALVACLRHSRVAMGSACNTRDWPVRPRHPYPRAGTDTSFPPSSSSDGTPYSSSAMEPPGEGESPFVPSLKAPTESSGRGGAPARGPMSDEASDGPLGPGIAASGRLSPEALFFGGSVVGPDGLARGGTGRDGGFSRSSRNGTRLGCFLDDCPDRRFLGHGIVLPEKRAHVDAQYRPGIRVDQAEHGR